MINIYEVMAIEGGCPLFLDRHMDRFYKSIRTYSKITKESLYTLVIDKINLILTELSSRNNIKVVYNVESEEIVLEVITSRKPTKNNYIKGGKIGIFNGIRENPLEKRENKPLRELTDRQCKAEGLYDVLLINNSGYITEGSRSNFLLIKDSKIITSPLGDALNGVTRDVIFDICREEEIEVLEQKVDIELLKSCDNLLITGTSPEIFPIHTCNDKVFTVNSPLIKKIIEKFVIKKLEDIKKSTSLALFQT